MLVSLSSIICILQWISIESPSSEDALRMSMKEILRSLLNIFLLRPLGAEGHSVHCLMWASLELGTVFFFPSRELKMEELTFLIMKRDLLDLTKMAAMLNAKAESYMLCKLR